MLIMSYVQNKQKRKTFKRYFKNFQWYLCHHQFNFIEIWIFSKNCTLNFKDNGKLFLDFIWSVWWRNFNLNRVFHPLFKKGFLIEKGLKNTWDCQHHFHIMQIEKNLSRFSFKFGFILFSRSKFCDIFFKACQILNTVY